MTAEQSQQILSRLYTDRDYRRSFLAGKDDFYKVQKIADPEIIAFLNALKVEQLEFFAKGLYAKKYHEVIHQIPGTLCLLKDRLGKLFRDFSETPRTFGVHKHHEEALAFIGFVKKEKEISAEERCILEFEESLIRNFLYPKAWHICLLRYDAPRFLRSLQAGEDPVLQKKRRLILFRKGRVFKVF